MLQSLPYFSLLSINIQTILKNIQTSEAISITLLITSAILSALFSEMILTKKLHNKKRLPPILLAVLCAVIFLFELLLILVLLAAIFHFFPHDESLRVLLQKVLKSYGLNFLIPFAAAILAGYALRGLKENKASAKILLAILLIVSTAFSSLEFFLSSFRLVERPFYPAPVEAVTSIINARLSVYPFILTEDILWSIGDGNDLLSRPEENPDAVEPADPEDDEPITYEEPQTIGGYIGAIMNGTYAEGMGKAEYLLKAHALFLKGSYTDDELFSIGLMWTFIYEDLYQLSDDEPVTADCLWEALAAYERVEELEGGSAPLYSNMSIVYNHLQEWDMVRYYVREALAYGVEESYAWSNYKGYILWWVGLEPYTQLLEDAGIFLEYGQDLSVYILYGACAAAENQETENAYRLLCEADAYFEGKSAMLKILRCICADLTGRDEAFLLSDIYRLEAENGLTQGEEAYLIRYLFATNRSEELWGYISDVGAGEQGRLRAWEAAMKASWYFKNADTGYFDREDARHLLERIEEDLSAGFYEPEDKNLLLLSRALLQSCMGEAASPEAFGTESYELEGVSDIEYALGAANAFNKGSYAEAIEYCEGFFSAEADRRESSADGGSSWQELEPQEQMTLHYYVQLILASAHFEYAQFFRKNSDEWTQHMEIAERECDAFEQSSKSLFYIGEQFRILKNGIDMANERMPEEDTAAVPLPAGS